MNGIVDIIAALFVIATFFAYINHKVIKLPPAIGMMVAALTASIVLVGVESFFPEARIAIMVHEAISSIDFSFTLMHVMLSFLLFAGALHVDLEALKKWWAAIFALAGIGTIISTVIVGLGTWLVLDLIDLSVPLAWCMVFGALISPTDPVAVLGIMKAARAPKDVEIKVVGESLFNDGVGVVIFAILVAFASGSDGHGGHELDAVGIAILVVQEIVGGVLLGLMGGFLTYYAMRTLDEPYLEMLLSLGLVMGIILVAFNLHFSAPLASVVAGLFIGNRGRAFAMSERTRDTLDTIWTFFDETLNALLFLMIGFEFIIIELKWPYALAVVLIVIVCLFARLVAVFVPLTALATLRSFRTGTRRLLFWGGLKGGISVALALSLPKFEGREIILTITYGVVVASILMQGLTIGKLIQRLMPPDETEPADAAAH